MSNYYSPMNPQQPQADHLSFYQPSGSSSSSGMIHPTGNMNTPSTADAIKGSISLGSNGDIQVQNWYNAFTPWTGSISQEPPLLDELGINFDHILAKSLTVLNPFKRVDPHIMDDADLAGPLVFCFIFASFLLLSGKPQFSYIYGVALIGSASMYFLLNLMSPSGIDAYRTASVLGYCILPLVLLSMVNVVINLDGMLGYILSSLFVLWSTYSSSSIFATVLSLSHQRFLVAYPVGLLYSAFSLFVFEVKKVK